MLPARAMTISHLRLKETPELSGNGPPNTVALLNPQLDNELTVWQCVDVDPDTIV